MELVVKDLSVSELSDDKNVYVEGYASAAVKDLDGDIITEEALEQAAKELTQEPYNKVFLNHKYDDIPIGKIVEAEVRNGKLWVKLMLNKAHPLFETVYKSLKERFLDAFSIGFKILERQGNKITRLKILEISLVGVPANPEAIVEDVYEKMLNKDGGVELTKGVVPSHPWKYGKDDKSSWKKPTLSDFTDKSWDELSTEEKRSIAGHFAWAPENPPKRFTDLKLPHHDPRTHAVVWRGVVAAMAALFGARGGVDIPSSDRRPVYNHLAAHYKEFGREPPEFHMLEELRIKCGGAIPEFIFYKILDGHLDLKSLISADEGMKELEIKVKELEAENQRLREENEQLKAKLAEYEEKEKAELIEKIKNVSKITKTEIDETELKKANVIELKLLYADLADKALSTKQVAEKVKTVLDEPEFIDSPFGKVDVRKYKELRKIVGLE
ncbi:HK97 family phage prohead protease [Archaeoglobus profundus]|uniref:Phage prohead protease, HK97 family n=1 Tax=Archaeoglobus profundus (strain DSM 5631 / JCM 9629 / NBRC 100127 / Av18) TaxID=572546 RepID=D2REK7_ARCPA|nr:HK97 family phage prohead protease [Archaeoglobus profundus]ADB58551.1 phage prohead protease, HK97 family [Archaeoglobus profundus DSM 5631]